ncbi:MAG: pantoate--beta-alanine ligase [Gammaproteobacteria bacterium]|nr:pantoate--beta-alanine ligase [Gammaproteobacteria bacterium]MDH5304670.1 pantoate--beta-alanine ligase [Gammaproteobacteria bacterium]MDH5323532.1 pantoate--beta-alanine ligase [Gammaproteobacteria bacterium]
MITISTRPDLWQRLSAWRAAGDRVALVPTMGNLHDGHASLVRIAKRHADRVVVSVFVNPTQFGPGEDYASYPRTLEDDATRLQAENVDLLFAPEIATMYPLGLEQATHVSVPGLGDELCGAARPGHFDGVTSVVLRLFALVQPDIAVFGQKDYQQQLIIRRMVLDLGLSVQVELGPIIREPSGLAMSSRNGNFSNTERSIAAALFEVLQVVAQELAAGNRKFAKLEAKAMRLLTEAGQSPEYVAIRQSADLAMPDAGSQSLIVLAASRVAGVRLIDNILVKMP